MPTFGDETLHDRYAREHAGHMARLAKMTAEQIAELELSLHNALAEVDRLRAQALADPEAEPVEVVGYLLTKGNQLSRMPAGGSDFPLMTVAQHNRIMASAPQHDAELVELLRACVDEFRGITMSRDLPQRIDAKLATLSAKPCHHIPLTSQFGTWCELCEKKLG